MQHSLVQLVAQMHAQQVLSLTEKNIYVIDTDKIYDLMDKVQRQCNVDCSPDLRRLVIRNSFSLIVAFACLCFSSSSYSACSVSSSFF